MATTLMLGEDNGFGSLSFLLYLDGGGNGYGNQGRGQVGGQEVGYELGKLATTNDVASGFASNAMIGGLNDIKLGQAGIQQTLCQGFSGVNTTHSSRR
jgi:hypothetical protein